MKRSNNTIPMSSSNPVGRLPTVIEHKLRAIQRRQIALTTTRGIAIGLGVMLVGMVLAMSVDWILVLFSPLTRTMLTITTLVVAAVTGLIALVGPLCRAGTRRVGSLGHAARVVDAHVPNLQRRWTTVTSLSRTQDALVTREQKSMQEQVTSEAVAMQSMVAPAKLVPFSLLRRPFFGLGICALALAGFLALSPQQTSVLWQRFWSPMQNITATKLTDQTNLQYIPRGETVGLTVRKKAFLAAMRR